MNGEFIEYRYLQCIAFTTITSILTNGRHSPFKLLLFYYKNDKIRSEYFIKTAFEWILRDCSN